MKAQWLIQQTVTEGLPDRSTGLGSKDVVAISQESLLSPNRLSSKERHSKVDMVYVDNSYGKKTLQDDSKKMAKKSVSITLNSMPTMVSLKQ